MCARLVDVEAPVKTKVEIFLIKLFNLQARTIDMSDQDVFTLKDSGLHDEEGKEIITSNPLTAAHRQSGHFLSFIMTVHPYQAGPNYKHISITCRACIQLPLYVNGINISIDTQMLQNPNYLPVHLVDLENGRNPDIGTLKK